MRGAILSTLKQKLSFLKANTITAFLFVFLHCPGWYFMGVLQLNFLDPLTGALAIFITGFMCGLAAEKGKSLYSAMIVHALNNLV
jgi:membrane protease YdiL (CAAX protease family)